MRRDTGAALHFLIYAFTTHYSSHGGFLAATAAPACCSALSPSCALACPCSGSRCARSTSPPPPAPRSCAAGPNLCRASAGRSCWPEGSPRAPQNTFVRRSTPESRPASASCGARPPSPSRAERSGRPPPCPRACPPPLWPPRSTWRSRRWRWTRPPRSPPTTTPRPHWPPRPPPGPWCCSGSRSGGPRSAPARLGSCPSWTCRTSTAPLWSGWRGPARRRTRGPRGSSPVPRPRIPSTASRTRTG
mmetsp:Transcript_812/g.2498  ORF Transcript_812/g.2498 Transcript_812/m.2498 type:complete len:246 (+) Transcript_812:569-1306(+)